MEADFWYTGGRGGYCVCFSDERAGSVKLLVDSGCFSARMLTIAILGATSVVVGDDASVTYKEKNGVPEVES